jgi:hypothetical protein
MLKYCSEAAVVLVPVSVYSTVGVLIRCRSDRNVSIKQLKNYFYLFFEKVHILANNIKQ